MWAAKHAHTYQGGWEKEGKAYQFAVNDANDKVAPMCGVRAYHSASQPHTDRHRADCFELVFVCSGAGVLPHPPPT